MTAPDEEALLRRISEALVTALRVKTKMIAAGENYRTMPCPRCGSVLRFRISGRRNHVSMACVGLCGMQAME